MRFFLGCFPPSFFLAPTQGELIVLSSRHFSSVQSLSRVRLFAISWTVACQASLSITNSSSFVPFSSCLQSFPAIGSFPVSQFFTSGGQSIGISALESFLPKNTQDRSPSEWTGCISLKSKRLSRVFSNITLQKHQFFGAQLSSLSNSHVLTWPLEKP